MDRTVAEGIIHELRKHPRIITPDSSLFLDVLVSTEVPASSRFYEVLPGTKQTLEEGSSIHHLSLRRILRNSNARVTPLSAGKRLYQYLVSTYGAYSSDALSRNVRTERSLVEVMAQCGEPYSLLGKFQTHDFETPELGIFTITRPVLIIPGVRDRSALDEWEQAHATYEKEITALGGFRRQKRITPLEYAAL